MNQIQRSLDEYHLQGGNQIKAALALGIPRQTLQGHLRIAARRKMKPSPHIDAIDDVPNLRLKIKRLTAELQQAEKARLDAQIIKREIIGLKRDVSDVVVPTWALKEEKKSQTAFGVPTILLSDLHAGEVVDPHQINGVNEFHLKIFDQRMENLAESAIRLLSILSPMMEYPGLVLALGGDNCSGNIHEELTATNELNSMPVVLHLYRVIGGFITTMAKKFGRVHIEAVTGNHGRDTRKTWNKDRHHTSFDWLLYCFLAEHFTDDDRVTFHIPDGPDAYYQIYNYRYCLTHGDQFRSFGDSMIGALGPIIRGDIKKRSRNMQINLDYDTLIMGHWHQYIHLNRLIVNGSVKGYDEYANQANFPFEQPQQAMWLTHPKYGITYRAPVYVDRIGAVKQTNWVSVAK